MEELSNGGMREKKQRGGLVKNYRQILQEEAGAKAWRGDDEVLTTKRLGDQATRTRKI